MMTTVNEKNAPGRADWVMDLLIRDQLGCNHHTGECFSPNHDNKMHSYFSPTPSLSSSPLSLPLLFNFQRHCWVKYLQPVRVNSAVREVHWPHTLTLFPVLCWSTPLLPHFPAMEWWIPVNNTVIRVSDCALMKNRAFTCLRKFTLHRFMHCSAEKWVP